MLRRKGRERKKRRGRRRRAENFVIKARAKERAKRKRFPKPAD